jgi:hypothetical protein
MLDRWLRRPSGQRRVLLLARPQPPGLRYLKPTQLSFPIVERRRADPVAATTSADSLVWDPTKKRSHFTGALQRTLISAIIAYGEQFG